MRHRELPVGQLGGHGGDALQMVAQVVAEIEVVAEKGQAGQHRDAQQGQGQPQGAAAGGALGAGAGHQQPAEKIHHAKEEEKTDKPGQPVDGLLGELMPYR